MAVKARRVSSEPVNRKDIRDAVATAVRDYRLSPRFGITEGHREAIVGSAKQSRDEEVADPPEHTT